MSLATNKDTTTAQATETGAETKPQAVENGLPKTQEELDAIIDARLARERKKMAKQQQGQTPPAQTESNVQTAQQHTQPPAVDTAVHQENLMLKAQVAAIKDGIKPDIVEDAIYLAMREAESKGEADEDGIKDALKNVLKRHPEWSSKKEEKGGGFKVGAGQSESGSGSQKKTMPAGTVIL